MNLLTCFFNLFSILNYQKNYSHICINVKYNFSFFFHIFTHIQDNCIKCICVDPHFGSTFFLNLLQLIWPGGVFLGGHVSIPDWLSWNQNSVFESQSEIDTWQEGICKKLQTVRGAGWPAAREGDWVRFSGGGVLFRWCFSIREGGAEIF